MAVPSRPARLRISGRSIAASGVALALTVFALHVLASATRVLMWIASAAAVAALLHPTVVALTRALRRRGLAVLVVMTFGLAVSAGVVYMAVDGVVRQTRALQRAAPARAADIEREGRLAEAARSFHLRAKVKRAVDDLPSRLRGGNGAEAAKSAVSRGVALLATLVLTVFLLLNGPRLFAAGIEQIRDDDRRTATARVLLSGYRRGFGYVRGTVAMAAVAGAVGYAIARLAGVPGPAPLAFWIALWDVVPLIGATVGAFPLAALALIGHPVRGIAVVVAVIAYQVAESFFVQPRVERATVKLGPFVTALAGFAGFELYRLIGALLAITAAAVVAAAADALAADEPPRVA